MSSKLYVGNLPQSANKQILKDTFSQYGTVDLVNVITERDTGHSRGFAFIEMSSNDEAQKAIQELNGFSLDGHEIKVNEAKPKASRDDRGGGGYGGGGYDGHGHDGGNSRGSYGGGGGPSHGYRGGGDRGNR